MFFVENFSIRAHVELQLQELVTSHRDFVVHAFERGASSAAYAAARAMWLLAIPILGAFPLERFCKNLGHGRIQASYLRGGVRTVLNSQASEYKHLDQVHLSNCPSPILLTKPRMLLYPGDKGSSK